VLKNPAVIKKIEDQGGDVVIDTQAQFDAYIKSEAAKWGKVVKESGAQV
jgi:tripartite-type tricarboxylate transporter receptor subunit TctC